MSILQSLPVQSLADYLEGRQHVFPSPESLRWLIRSNRAELIKRGAVLYPRGRPLIHPEKFDEAVLDIGKRKGLKFLST